jgi:type II pantothenate kinase
LISLSKEFPWFGIDIGGTLVKLVYFEPLDLSADEQRKEGDVLKTIRHYLIGNTAYGETGIRDVHLELRSIKIGKRLGNLHFIRFPTSQMELFIELCVSRRLHTLTFEVYATGGGAFKFESIVRERLNIGWNKCDGR